MPSIPVDLSLTVMSCKPRIPSIVIEEKCSVGDDAMVFDV